MQCNPNAGNVDGAGWAHGVSGALVYMVQVMYICGVDGVRGANEDPEDCEGNKDVQMVQAV